MLRINTVTIRAAPCLNMVYLKSLERNSGREVVGIHGNPGSDVEPSIPVSGVESCPHPTVVGAAGINMAPELLFKSQLSHGLSIHLFPRDVALSSVLYSPQSVPSPITRERPKQESPFWERRKAKTRSSEWKMH